MLDWFRQLTFLLKNPSLISRNIFVATTGESCLPHCLKIKDHSFQEDSGVLTALFLKLFLLRASKIFFDDDGDKVGEKLLATSSEDDWTKLRKIRADGQSWEKTKLVSSQFSYLHFHDTNRTMTP